MSFTPQELKLLHLSDQIMELPLPGVSGEKRKPRKRSPNPNGRPIIYHDHRHRSQRELKRRKYNERKALRC